MCFSGKRNSERCRRETCYVIKIYFHYLSQAKVKVIWFIVKAKSKPNWFIFRFCYSALNFVICGGLCVITPTAYVVLFWLGACDVWVAFEHLVFALFDRVYLIFYASFELVYLASLTQLRIIRHWDLLLSHNDTLIELFAVYRFYPIKRSSDFCAWSDIWNRYISTRKSRY